MAILNVSQLNRYVCFLLQGDRALQSVLVRGEISNFTNHYRFGHYYFTLRDDTSGVKAVMFRSNAQRLKFMPKDGMQVIVAATASLYEKEGAFQLYVTDLQSDGTGLRTLALEDLKKKLTTMGAFDVANKQSLPPMPQKIGVVTSDTGAALQDIRNIMERRYPIGHLHVFPAQVQGEMAPDSICDAIRAAEMKQCDVILVGRGGGASEDLAAFQTEKVVMAIYHCGVPIVSAVGHETDWTLADAAADLRAPTPSAAAELAVPNIKQLMHTVAHFSHQLQQQMEKILQQKQQRLNRFLDRLRLQTPVYRQTLAQEQLDSILIRLSHYQKNIIAQRQQQLTQIVQRLELLNPYKILEQGYALVYHGETLLHRAVDVAVGEQVEIRLEHGKIQAEVKMVFDDLEEEKEI